MSNGKTHDLSIWATAPWVGLGVYAFAPEHKIESALVAIAGHLMGGLMLSPDLDLPSRPWRRWGWFRIIWIPYQKITRHRGVSHAPFIGMLLRVLYLALPVIAFVIYRGMDQWGLLFFQAHWMAIVIFWIGLELSVWVHLTLDGILIKKLRG